MQALGRRAILGENLLAQLGLRTQPGLSFRFSSGCHIVMNRRTLSYSGVFLAGLLAIVLATGCAKDQAGTAPLIRAAWDGDAKQVNALLGKGADINARDSGGMTALMASTWSSSGRGDVEIAKVLIAQGADVDAANQHGRTALHEVTGSGNGQFVNLLLAHGANVNAQTVTGQTPLMEAALNGRTDIVKTLLRNSANPNAQETTSGYTALMLAAMKGHAEIVALLIDRGADVNARDKKGNTALTFARLESKRGVQWKDIERLLEKAGAKK